jgi:uncharacterized protein (DUF433 family)
MLERSLSTGRERLDLKATGLIKESDFSGGILSHIPPRGTAMSQDLLQRISMNPEICHGKPCVRGLRYPVELLLELLSSGMTHAEILADYEDLEEADILAVLLFAARLSQVKSIYRLAS